MVFLHIQTDLPQGVEVTEVTHVTDIYLVTFRELLVGDEIVPKDYQDEMSYGNCHHVSLRIVENELKACRRRALSVQRRLLHSILCSLWHRPDLMGPWMVLSMLWMAELRGHTWTQMKKSLLATRPVSSIDPMS